MWCFVTVLRIKIIKTGLRNKKTTQIPIRRCNLVHIFSLTSYLIHLTLASLILIENFILFIFESLNLKKEGIYIFLIKNLILMLMSYI
jgi:hypothetical protein